MALQDLFTEPTTDTDLDAHTSDSGHSWTWDSNGATTKKLTVYQSPDTCGRSAAGGTNQTTWYSSSWTPGSAEYWAEVDYVHKTSGSQTPMSLALRFTATNNYYQVVVNVTALTLVLNKNVSGTVTELGNYTITTSPPQTHVVKFECKDATKKVFLDGVERISSSDNALTATGKVALGGGIVNGGATVGVHFDNLDADVFTGVTLTVDDATHGHAAEAPSLTQANTLVAQDAQHTHVADAPDLTQANTLAAQDATHGHAADNVTVSSGETLSVNEAVHDQDAENVALTQANVLVAQDSAHSHTVDNVELTQANTLAAHDALHDQIADSPELTQANVLVAQDATHTHAADNVVLTLGGALDIADALHSHIADTPSLTQANVLVVQEAAHVQTADSATLTQASTLVVADTLHSQSAESPTPTISFNIVVADALHTHTADNAMLSTLVVLSVADAHHLQFADAVGVQPEGWAPIETATLLMRFTKSMSRTVGFNKAITRTMRF